MQKYADDRSLSQIHAGDFIDLKGLSGLYENR